ncbi:porin [Glaciimonas sp. PCH181]|uniref:porin n=1 Tax=Glaciimonas sp. PCH181 TaxID=2133943 RepID=UPI000D334A9B|nr:porin [Glaciimonas sp. PCH181]PUA17691.1 porin [Glaciimonas sp. PCH181]
MKRTLIPIALLGMMAQGAFAQTSVTVYGVADMGLVQEKGGPNGAVTKLTSGIGYGSRLGFKGVEDLGGGLSAKFVLEAGILMDTGASGQGGLLFGRQSFVGLSGGAGTVNLGRQYTPYYWTLLTLDPFLTGYAGTAANLMSNTGGRTNNTVLYSSPTFGGFSGDVAYSFGEVAGSIASSSAVGGVLNYVNGPLLVKLSYHHADNATATDASKNTLLGGTYDFGIAKVHVAYARNLGLGINSNDALVGVTVPFGPHRILASFINKDDKTAAHKDANQIAVGYVYNLSKRTELYTAYALINNKNGASYTVGNGTELGSGNRAFNFGMRNFF